MSLNEVFQKLTWALVSGCALYASNQLKDLSVSVSQLNTNVAVLVERVTNQERNYEAVKADMAAIRSRLDSVERHGVRSGT